MSSLKEVFDFVLGMEFFVLPLIEVQMTNIRCQLRLAAQNVGAGLFGAVENES